MPKNVKGGSKHKKMKNTSNNDEIKESDLILKSGSEQDYGKVEKILGNGRFNILCNDKVTRLGIIRGKMRKREWVNMGGGVDEDSIPESIRMETANYKNQNDIVGQWISEDLDVCEDESTPFNEIWNAFENWFTENHSNGKVDKIVVKRRLIDWQKRSRFGFSDTMNGNERHPKFNLVPKPE